MIIYIQTRATSCRGLITKKAPIYRILYMLCWWKNMCTQVLLMVFICPPSCESMVSWFKAVVFILVVTPKNENVCTAMKTIGGHGWKNENWYLLADGSRRMGISLITALTYFYQQSRTTASLNHRSKTPDGWAMLYLVNWSKTSRAWTSWSKIKKSIKLTMKIYHSIYMYLWFMTLMHVGKRRKLV